MTNKTVQYYIDKDKLIDIQIENWSNGNMAVSIYNDRNNNCVTYICNKKELKGLADFIYQTIGEKK